MLLMGQSCDARVVGTLIFMGAIIGHVGPSPGCLASSYRAVESSHRSSWRGSSVQQPFRRQLLPRAGTPILNLTSPDISSRTGLQAASTRRQLTSAT